MSEEEKEKYKKYIEIPNYSIMTPDEYMRNKIKLHDDYTKFKKQYDRYPFIKDMDSDDTPLENLHYYITKLKKQFIIYENVQTQKIYLTLFWMVLEILVKNLLKIDIKGYTEIQLKLLDVTYSPLLIKLKKEKYKNKTIKEIKSQISAFTIIIISVGLCLVMMFINMIGNKFFGEKQCEMILNKIVEFLSGPNNLLSPEQKQTDYVDLLGSFGTNAINGMVSGLFNGGINNMFTPNKPSSENKNIEITESAYE
jgi:hypothetical protein